MKKDFKYLSWIVLAILIIALGLTVPVFLKKNGGGVKIISEGESSPLATSPFPAEISPIPEIKFVGPREGLPEGAPKDYGLWSFAMPVQGVLSRSGQPLLSGFKWMKENGWNGVVDLRVDGERGEVGDDTKIPGFNELNLNYLALPIADGAAPTNEQAEQFLAFVKNPANQIVHVHCRGGIGRAGTMVALYRYAVQGWPVGDVIEESKPFEGGISEAQIKWLKKWAESHASGSYR